MQEVEGSWQLEHYRTKKDSLASPLFHDWNLRLVPIARESHQNPLFSRKITFHIPHIPYYKYPYTHEMLRASRKNFERKPPKNNKIDSFTILYIWLFKFLYSHPLHWHTLERSFNQIPTSPHSYQWEGYLVLKKQFREDQFIWLLQWAYCGI